LFAPPYLKRVLLSVSIKNERLSILEEEALLPSKRTQHVASVSTRINGVSTLKQSSKRRKHVKKIYKCIQNSYIM
jgi:hypothetical protein